MTFRGTAALVTGAASGMGQLTAWRLAAEGVPVAALDVDEEGLRHTASRAASVRPWVCDVADWSEVQRVVGEAEEALGPIDRVVNAAAIAPTGPLLEQSVEAIARMTQINYLGTVHITKATLPAMLDRGHGDLVLYASLAGWVPAPGFGAYAATKHAVVAFAEVLHHENQGRGVRMACVCPPIVDTPLLEQVNVGAGPLVEASGTIRPEIVIDAVEHALDRNEFWVFPGQGTRAVQWVRRLAPGVLWRGFRDIQDGKGPGLLGAFSRANRD